MFEKTVPMSPLGEELFAMARTITDVQRAAYIAGAEHEQKRCERLEAENRRLTARVEYLETILVKADLAFDAAVEAQEPEASHA